MRPFWKSFHFFKTISFLLNKYFKDGFKNALKMESTLFFLVQSTACEQQYPNYLRNYRWFLFCRKQIGKTKFLLKIGRFYFILFICMSNSVSNCCSVYPIPDELWPGCSRFCLNSPRIHWGIVSGNVQEHLGQLYYLYSW